MTSLRLGWGRTASKILEPLDSELLQLASKGNNFANAVNIDSFPSFPKQEPLN